MLDVLNLFMKYGGDPTIKNKIGFTALHIAAKEGRPHLVQLLLAKGKPYLTNDFVYRC